MKGWKAAKKGSKRTQFGDEVPSIRIRDPLSCWVWLRNLRPAALLDEAVVALIVIIILRLILATNVDIIFLHFCSNSRFNCSDVNSFVILYL